jgi:hypothetical protein
MKHKKINYIFICFKDFLIEVVALKQQKKFATFFYLFANQLKFIKKGCFSLLFFPHISQWGSSIIREIIFWFEGNLDIFKTFLKIN